MALTLRDISCTRGGRVLIRELSLTLARGEIALVRGANGAGKSSLLRLIAGLLRPEGGSISWGDETVDAPLATQIHYLGHLDGLKPALTVRETLAFWGQLLGGDAIGAAISDWQLSALADLPCGILSAGQRRRVALARLGVCARPIWLLDEPTGPLDEAGASLVAKAVKKHCSEGGVAVIATHRDLDVGEAQVVDLGLGGAGE